MNKYIKFPKWLQALLMFIKLDDRFRDDKNRNRKSD